MKGGEATLLLCVVYLFFGLALIAMCFDLIQEEVSGGSVRIWEGKEGFKRVVRTWMLGCCRQSGFVENKILGFMRLNVVRLEFF